MRYCVRPDSPYFNRIKLKNLGTGHSEEMQAFSDHLAAGQRSGPPAQGPAVSGSPLSTPSWASALHA